VSEDRDHTLSLAFMRDHPQQAASVLDALPAPQAALLFARAPARVGAAVLTAMVPQRAARCIAALTDTRALEVLLPMGTQPTVAVMRHLPEQRRRALIAALPATASLASALLLGFTEDSVGAWADPDVVALAVETRASDALDRVRSVNSAYSIVFAVDAERRLTGIVDLTTLLRAPDAATLGTLMSRPDAVLAAHAPLSGAIAHPGWEHRSTLPVVEPGQRLVGVITRDALARALRGTSPTPGTIDEPSVPALLASGYWQALNILVESGLALLPRVPSAEDSSDAR